jgi:hypothetical protein
MRKKRNRLAENDIIALRFSVAFARLLRRLLRRFLKIDFGSFTLLAPLFY